MRTEINGIDPEANSYLDIKTWSLGFFSSYFFVESGRKRKKRWKIKRRVIFERKGGFCGIPLNFLADVSEYVTNIQIER